MDKYEMRAEFAMRVLESILRSADIDIRDFVTKKIAVETNSIIARNSVCMADALIKALES